MADIMKGIRKDAHNMNAWQLAYKYSIDPHQAAAFVAHATMQRYSDNGQLKSGGYTAGKPSVEPPMRRPKQTTTTIVIQITTGSEVKVKVDQAKPKGASKEQKQ